MTSIAQYGLIILLSGFLMLHLGVLLKIIPYNLVWGGRLQSDKEMIRFELVSIVVNLFFLVIVFIQSNLLKLDFPPLGITIVLWVMTALFVLNTLGNALSKNKIEQRLFTPITILLAIFSSVLAWVNT